MITVFLVGDHDLVRVGIKRILDDYSGVKVVGEWLMVKMQLPIVVKIALTLC